MKYCPACDENLSDSLFNYKNKAKGTLASYCKVHQSEYTKKHYQSNPNEYKQRARDATSRKQQFIREAKDKYCKDCNIKYPYYVMQFDHKFDKKFNVSRMANRCSWKQIIEEISKCDIVCGNCHAERTWGLSLMQNSGFQTRTIGVQVV